MKNVELEFVHVFNLSFFFKLMGLQGVLWSVHGLRRGDSRGDSSRMLQWAKVLQC